MNSFFYTFLQRFSLVFLGAASFILLVHVVSPEEFANWALFTVIFSTIDMVKTGLLRNALIKFLASHPSDRPVISTASLFVNLTLTALMVVMILFCAGPASVFLKAPALDSLLFYAIPMVIALSVFTHYEILLQSAFRFDVIFTANFVRPVVQFGGMLLLYLLDRSLLTIYSALLLQTIGVVLGSAYIAWKGWDQYSFNGGLDLSIARKMVAFGKYTSATNLLSQVSRSFDHLLTAYYLPPAVSGVFVSYYNVVSRINNMVDVPSLAVADVVYPRNVQAMQEEGVSKVKYYFEKVAAAVLAIILPISLLLFIFPGQALRVIGGAEYENAKSILRISVIVGVIRPLTYLFGSVMDSIGKPQTNFYVNLLLLISSFLLNSLFIRQFGGMGAAYALPIQYLLTLGCMYQVLRRTMGFDGKGVFKSLISTYPRLIRIFQKKP